MNDNKIIDEAVALMNEGYSVTLPVSGRSMLPFIIGGKESVILAPPAGLKRGIVALAWVENRRYVLHRIERIEGERVTLMGDGNLVGREHCSIGDVKAIATHVVDSNQKRHYLYTRWRKTASEIWWALLPLRRYILKLEIRKNMKKKDGMVLREVCGEKVLVGEGLGAVDFGRLISLNDTAAYLWEQLDEDSDIDSLTQALCKEYDVEQEVARHDVEAILEEWIKTGVVDR